MRVPLFLVPLLLVASVPAVASAFPGSSCVQAVQSSCPGLACVSFEALTECVAQPITCTEMDGDCPVPYLACFDVADTVGGCLNDPCYRDPELCHPMLA
ncbi:MAG: hypothetical protein QOE90_542 [Thermoplasmata archaeon]|jgi:hypothetical protein|nr:hypothetical protein [Thermoplasmata archaeon]